MKRICTLLAVSALLLASCEKEEDPVAPPLDGPGPLSYTAEVTSYKQPGQLVEVRRNPMRDTAAVAAWHNSASYYFLQLQLNPGDTLDVRSRFVADPEPADTGVVTVRLWRVTTPTTISSLSTSGTEWTTQRWIMP